MTMMRVWKKRKQKSPTGWKSGNELRIVTSAQDDRHLIRI